MTDRAKGCWVAFKDDYRTDDVESLVSAIEQLRGVQAVTLNLADSDDWMNRERIRWELKDQIYAVLEKKG